MMLRRETSVAVNISHGRQRILEHIRQDGIVALSAIGFATILGGIIRFRLALIDIDFPIGDGGLFYQMTREILASNYVIPKYTAYNSFYSIPFAYPPLGLYLAAVLSDVTGWSLLRIFSLMPAIVSTLTIPVAYPLFRQLLRSEAEAATAVLVFALLPRSISWMIIGGGITRSLGLLFSLLTLSEAYSLLTTRRRAKVISTAILASLTILSHTEWALYILFSAAIMFIFYGLSRESIISSMLTIVLVILFTAPWWGTVISYHGLTPFLSAFGSGEVLESPFKEIFFISYNFTHEPMLGVLAVMGLLGLFVCLADGRWFLASWLVAIFVLHSRNAGTESIIAISMMVGVTIHRLIVPGLLRLSQANKSLDYSHGERSTVLKLDLSILLRRIAIWLPILLFALSALYYSFLGGLIASRQRGIPLHMIGEGDREAMKWVSAGTPEDSRFLVITSASTWHLDLVSEWFPAVAGRTSLGTVQGTEWLPEGAFQRNAGRYFDLQRCAAFGTVACLETWAWQGDVDYTHVFVASSATGKLASVLRLDPYYNSIYVNTHEEGEIVIFEYLRAED